MKFGIEHARRGSLATQLSREAVDRSRRYLHSIVDAWLEHHDKALRKIPVSLFDDAFHPNGRQVRAKARALDRAFERYRRAKRWHPAHDRGEEREYIAKELYFQIDHASEAQIQGYMDQR